MAEKLGLDDGVRELKLGSSFDKGGPEAYHSIRYDFKPASMDKTQMSTVDVGEGNSVTVTVPHVEGSGTSHTVYKGNKRPCQKECVLIIDHKTGEITLEKLNSNVHLKKTRQEGSSRVNLQQQQRPHTPTDKTKDLKASPPKRKKMSPPRGSQQSSQEAKSQQPSQEAKSQQSSQEAKSQQSSQTDSQQGAARGSATDIQQVAAPRPSINSQPKAPSPSPKTDLMSSSSSSDSSSDSDDDPSPELSGSATSAAHSAPTNKADYHMLSMDLQLSESGSDSD